jgi:prepilin-type N-terminal cleavage/methylation domain-containing protein
MHVRSNQDGFTAIELVIVVLIVAILGFVGYTVYSRQNAKTVSNTTPAVSPTSTNPSASAHDVASAPSISSSADLDKAATMLDQTDLNSSSSADSTQLDSQLSTF